MLTEKMKKMLGTACVLGAMLASCSQNPDITNPVEGQGLLSLTLGAQAEFPEGRPTNRVVSETTYGNTDNYTVIVTDRDGIEKLRCKGSELSTRMPLILSMGSYRVQAYYGVEYDASRDGFYVYGEAQGNIKAGQKEAVEVVCTPTCGRITVNFDSNMKNYFSDYKVTFKGTEALGSKTIEWLKGDTEPWYVKLKEGGETISYTIALTTKDEYLNSNQQQQATKTGTFVLKRNAGYKMNVSASYTPTNVGNGKITITIDDSTNDKPVDIEVPLDWI